ncbi:MAG: FAD-dependent oxidoreductase, partial [Gammaproteobacteria bacterium]|nr:FAD-dependent oxidoreductase [Gammaproteobacteria bacterium]
MALPTHTKFLIIGAGIHGLSTAYHLARALKARRQGGGADILVVDKTGLGAGASGIACGVVRNNYFQPAMRELMAHSVNVWESDSKAY